MPFISEEIEPHKDWIVTFYNDNTKNINLCFQMVKQAQQNKM